MYETSPLSLQEFIFRCLVAAILGILVGVERQVKGHPAGIRTNTLVSLGSCMFVLFPMIIGSTDVNRSASQIITGIGFLGSGIIFKEGANVKGINTAATIWCSGAIGVLASSGQFGMALIAAGLIIVCNIMLKPLSHALSPSAGFDENDCYYQITCLCTIDVEWEIRALILSHFNNNSIFIVGVDSAITKDHKLEIRTTFRSRNQKRDDMAEKITKSLSLETGVIHVGWKAIEN